MFTKNNTPIEGINGYSLYVLSKMLISNKEEGLLVEEKSHSINKNSENLIQSRNNNKNSLHPRQGNGLVYSDTENRGLIDTISHPKTVSEIAQTIQSNDFSGSNTEKTDTTADIDTKCKNTDIKYDLSSTKSFLPNKKLLDEDGNLYEKLDDHALKARLDTIITSRTAEYGLLMQIDLFERFVSGDRLDGIGTEDYNREHPEHKALVYGLCALCQYIELPNGDRVRVGQFLNDVAFSHLCYERKKRAKKTTLMAKLLKDVEGIKAANKKRFGINKIIPFLEVIDDPASFDKIGEVFGV